ncbi:hypothetical protein RFH42_01775 [Acinetobacter rudis]|uniref:hypothetical protein n=1 Tax=Acinetobacter rudis TaxID=632955 RepID=UPI00280F88E5|nr:hypothetical protein [Acinetobacter rudis]MDQ8951687.1 hypothetical protein [Acinetobacter rudis]
MNKCQIFICLSILNFPVSADLIDQNSTVSNDRLGELVKTVQGTYDAPKLNANIRGQQARIISEEYSVGKYGTPTSTATTQVKPIHPRIGMTKRQVLNNTTWGEPTSVRSIENRSGYYEIWMYYNAASLTFKNGILEVINRY